MNKLVANYLNKPNYDKDSYLQYVKGDAFIASVINQKSVHQEAQQVLVAIAAQVIYLIEAQFGFSTNDDSDTVTI
jgi:hypothetical protein